MIHTHSIRFLHDAQARGINWGEWFWERMVVVVLEILLIAVSLAMDAFAVSISCGVSVRGFGPRQAVQVGCWFGAFQFLMPVAGWLLGSQVSGLLRSVDHWLAFGLLVLISGNMIAESLHSAAGEGRSDVLTPGRLTVLAVATSIDALAVGLSLAFVGPELLPGGSEWTNLLLAAALIGGVAFVLSTVGGLLGRRLGSLLQRRAELAGGLVLAAIGVKILVEHLSGAG